MDKDKTKSQEKNEEQEKSKWRKVLIECVGATGGSFVGVFTLWQIIDYVLGGEFLKLSQAVIPYILLSIIVSFLCIIPILYKNKVISIGANRLVNAKKVISEHYNYTPAYHLEYDKNTGKLTNRAKAGDNTSGERQTLLRVKTFNNVLDGIYTFSLNNEKYFADGVNALDFCNSLIRKCGYMCGKRFALAEEKDFKMSVTSSDPQEALTEILDKWCEFDSKAGFGVFDIGEISRVKRIDGDIEAEEVHFTITLKDDFVSEEISAPLEGVEGVDGEEFYSERCHFMRGYCEGVCDVLGKVYGAGSYFFKVDDCDKSACRAHGGISQICVYNVKGRPRALSAKK